MNNFETLLREPQKLPSEETIDRELSRRYLDKFVQRHWQVVETRPFVSNWHIDAICEHLTAVTEGQITRLVINIPPRHTKSLTVSVMWPAWSWVKNPGLRYVFASYAQQLSTRDSVKCRRIIRSQIYRSLITLPGEDLPLFSLVGDQNTKTRFENDRNGYRLATSVDAYATGEGGDVVAVDDPISIDDANSETERDNVISWWDEEMSSRLDDPKTGAFVIMMQRTHQKDLSGHVLAKDAGYEHLCLPAEYEGNRCKTSINFQDPRTKEGELLNKKRFGRPELEALKKALGTYASAGQLQQRPAPRGGGMFKKKNFILVNEFPRGQIVKSVRYWDKAATAGGGCQTAGTLMHQMSDNSYVIEHCESGHWSWQEREMVIRKTAELDGINVDVWLEQEGGSGGKESAQSTVINLAGYNCFYEPVTGKKPVRATPYANQVEAQNVKVLIRPWTTDFIDEHCDFPTGTFLDKVDASAGAFNKLLLVEERIAGVW